MSKGAWNSSSSYLCFPNAGITDIYYHTSCNNFFLYIESNFCLFLSLVFREAFPEKECTRFFFFSENDDRLHGRSILPFSGVEQVVVQVLLIVYSTQLHMQVLIHCSLMCIIIPFHYKAFRGQ